MAGAQLLGCIGRSLGDSEAFHAGTKPYRVTKLKVGPPRDLGVELSASRHIVAVRPIVFPPFHALYEEMAGSVTLSLQFRRDLDCSDGKRNVIYEPCNPELWMDRRG